MKKLVLGCLLVFSTVSFFNSCSKDKDDETTTTTSESTTGSSSSNSGSSSSTTDTVVVINGVKWATRNVASPATFATNPEDAGLFYQWNGKVGWPATGEIGSITATDGSTTWNSSWEGGYTNPSSTDTWTSTNDPSPAGYRVPTLAEIKTLIDTTKVTHTWTTQNSVNGEKFTDKTTGNSIFLPASGLRGGNDGTLDDAGSYGHYWSSTAHNTKSFSAYNLCFSSYYAAWRYDFHRACGFTVRPVVE